MVRVAKLAVSVSGGRTSAYMARWIQTHPDEVAAYLGADRVDVVYTFANTGMEHEDTLRFVRDLGENFGLDIHWIETQVQHGARASSEPVETTYEKAWRNDQWMNPRHPFHAVIIKYGIPCGTRKHCTREMKYVPMTKFARRHHGTRDIVTAIGIRADESRRARYDGSAEGYCLVYPLCHWEPVDKDDVLEFWRDYAWDLTIPEHLGNCVMCYKKSFKKLALVDRDMPGAFDFTQLMESVYGFNGPEFRGEGRRKTVATKPRHFFRGGHNTRSMLDYVRGLDLAGAAPAYIRESDINTCSESCEPFETVPGQPRAPSAIPLVNE